MTPLKENKNSHLTYWSTLLSDWHITKALEIFANRKNGSKVGREGGGRKERNLCSKWWGCIVWFKRRLHIILYLTLPGRWPVGESLKVGGLQCCVGNDCKKRKTNTGHSFKISLYILIRPMVKKRINLRNTGEIKQLFFADK